MKSSAGRGLRTVLSLLAVGMALLGLRARDARPEREEVEGPGEAQEFFAAKRAPRGQKAVPTHRYLTARQVMQRMARYSTRAGATVAPSLPNLGTWSYLGPGNIGGRTRAIVF